MHAAALGVSPLVHFLGERDDLPIVLAAADVGWVAADGDDAGVRLPRLHGGARPHRVRALAARRRTTCPTGSPACCCRRPTRATPRRRSRRSSRTAISARRWAEPAARARQRDFSEEAMIERVRRRGGGGGRPGVLGGAVSTATLSHYAQYYGIRGSVAALRPPELRARQRHRRADRHARLSAAGHPARRRRATGGRGVPGAVGAGGRADRARVVREPRADDDRDGAPAHVLARAGARALRADRRLGARRARARAGARADVRHRPPRQLGARRRRTWRRAASRSRRWRGAWRTRCSTRTSTRRAGGSA